MVVRQGPDGRALLEGEQVQVGGNEVYVSLCRRHFRAATGDEPKTREHAPSPERAASPGATGACDGGDESPQ